MGIPNSLNPLRWPGMAFRAVGKYAYGFACDRCFERVDVDKSGYLEILEIEIAVLYLYNHLNKRLPGWDEPPSREVIEAAIKVYDTDGNKKLDKKEFQEFVKSIVNTGPDAFFARIGKNMVANSAILPASAMAVKTVAAKTPIGGVPLALLSPILGTVFKSVRGLIPF